MLYYNSVIYLRSGTIAKGEGASATGGLKLPYTYPISASIIDLKLVGFTTIDIYHVTAGKIATLDPASTKSYMGSIKDRMLAGSKQLQDAVNSHPADFYLYHEEAVGGAVADLPYIVYFETV